MTNVVVTGILVALLILSIVNYFIKRDKCDCNQTDEPETSFLDEIGVEKYPRSIDSDFLASKQIFRAVVAPNVTDADKKKQGQKKED